jgi:hypothetical protein
MIRKLPVVVAAITMSISAIALTGGVASARTPPVNATNYTATCTGISGSLSFNPPLTIAGGAVSPETVKTKASFSGCTATPTAGGASVSITKASITGTITIASSSHTCMGLSTGAATGNSTVKWTTSPKLSSGSSVASPGTRSGGPGGDGSIVFSSDYSGVTGSFEGTDGGASSSTTAQTTESFSSILATCETAKGLKKVDTETNVNTGAGEALSLQ